VRPRRGRDGEHQAKNRPIPSKHHPSTSFCAQHGHPRGLCYHGLPATGTAMPQSGQPPWRSAFVASRPWWRIHAPLEWPRRLPYGWCTWCFCSSRDTPRTCRPAGRRRGEHEGLGGAGVHGSRSWWARRERAQRGAVGCAPRPHCCWEAELYDGSGNAVVMRRVWAVDPPREKGARARRGVLLRDDRIWRARA
jgi:hypothetical protein